MSQTTTLSLELQPWELSLLLLQKLQHERNMERGTENIRLTYKTSIDRTCLNLFIST